MIEKRIFDLRVLRQLVAEAYARYDDEYQAWLMWCEDDPKYFSEAPDMAHMIAEYLLDNGVTVDG